MDPTKFMFSMHDLVESVDNTTRTVMVTNMLIQIDLSFFKCYLNMQCCLRHLHSTVILTPGFSVRLYLRL
jgi:hypothetical protein